VVEAVHRIHAFAGVPVDHVPAGATIGVPIVLDAAATITGAALFTGSAITGPTAALSALTLEVA
jgi:hypothetical protein